jgi:hypothetical protein
LFRVLRKSFGAGVVNVEGNKGGWDELEFTEQMTEPQDLFTCIGHGLILGLCAGE